MYVKVFNVNVNKRLKPFFLEQHINIVNIVTLQSCWFIFTIGAKNQWLIGSLVDLGLKGC